MPRDSASQISTSVMGRMMNCGSITPLMISVASSERFSRVSATWMVMVWSAISPREA